MGTMKIWDGAAWQAASQQGPAGTAPVSSVDGRTGAVVLSDLYVNVSGDAFTDGANIALGTATGTKWGTLATQKQSWWNATPVVQNTGWAATAGYTALRSFNPQTTTLAETARVLGTLVDTLKSYGLLG